MKTTPFDTFPVLLHTKADMLDYIPEKYHKYLKDIDAIDMEYLSRKLATEPVMWAYWEAVKCTCEELVESWDKLEEVEEDTNES